MRHTHSCDRCKTASVGCNGGKAWADPGWECEFEGHPEAFVCEDCQDLEHCENCGDWMPRELLREYDNVIACEGCRRQLAVA